MKIGKFIEDSELIHVNEEEEWAESSTLWNPDVVSEPLAVVAIEFDRGASLREKGSEKIQDGALNEVLMFEFPKKNVVLDGIKGTGEVEEDSIARFTLFEITLESV